MTFQSSPALSSEKVRAALYEQQRAGTTAFLNWVNWGEFFYIVKRKVGAARAAETLHLLEQLPIELVAIDLPLVREARRRLRASMRSPTQIRFA